LPSLGQAATASDISIPGIPPAGFPSFENNVSITQTRTGSGASAVTTLKAFDDPGSFVFKLNSSQSYNVTNTGYLLSATFNSAGNFTGGNLSITGIVQGYPGAPATVTNLYTANLASFAYDNVNDATPVALGFRTDNWSGWAAQFQQAPESAYLYNFNVIGFVNNLTNPLFKNTTFHGSAVTTVPIPAAAWLFGSALALLAGARRRKSIST
jgi:hypothetical protein